MIRSFGIILVVAAMANTEGQHDQLAVPGQSVTLSLHLPTESMKLFILFEFF